VRSLPRWGSVVVTYEKRERVQYNSAIEESQPTPHPAHIELMNGYCFMHSKQFLIARRVCMRPHATTKGKILLIVRATIGAAEKL
jgi:hypothetical protein